MLVPDADTSCSSFRVPRKAGFGRYEGLVALGLGTWDGCALVGYGWGLVGVAGGEPLDNARVRSGYLAQSRDSISKPDRPSERLESGFECLPFQVNGAVEIVLVMVG